MSASTFIAEFFNASTGSIYLCSLPNERGIGKPAELVGRGGGARLDDLVHQWDREDRGTFFCVNTLLPKQARRAKETVHEIVSLHADLDLDKIDMAPPGVLERLGQLRYLPSKIVHSGHGYHVYYLLNEAMLATQESIARVEPALKLLADHIGGDPAVCEISRLMRLPGSFNTKNGDRLPVRTIVDRPLRYELDELEEWLTEVRPFIPRKGAVPADNAFLAADIPGASSAPVDVDARLDGMRYRGPGESSVHGTQIACTAALLNRGADVEEIVAKVLAATRRAAGEAGARWDWSREERDIRAMCASWTRKKSNGQRPRIARDRQSGTSMEELGAMEFKPVSFLVDDQAGGAGPQSGI
jgi:hypothetical protein